MPHDRLFIGILAAALIGAESAQAQNYRTVLAEARSLRWEGPGWSATGLDLGAAHLSGDTLSLDLRGTGADTILIGIDVRTRPGLWVGGGWQRQWSFALAPGQTRSIALPYQFRRATPEATLRMIIGRAERVDGETFTFGDSTVRREFVLGDGNPAAFDPRPSFRRLASDHLEVFAWRGSLADRSAETILTEREAALRTLAEWLDIAPPEHVRLVFYPDSATKTTQTGHIGAGWATGMTLVEIYNDEVRLDPYHELAHIVAAALGSPPALLNEGFATWAAERLGADALEHLGNPGRTVDEVACAHLAELFTLRELLDRDEIGGPDSRAGLSYPHAASVVKFLVEAFGIERFREAYRTLRGSDDPAIRAENAATLERLYGQPLDALENAWRSAACQPTSWRLPAASPRSGSASLRSSRG